MAWNVICVMATGREIKCHLVWEWIFLLGRRTHLLKPWCQWPSARSQLKRQYSLSCFTVTLQFDILISLILSFTVSSQSDSACACARVPTFKCAMHWKPPIIKGNIPLTRGIGRCAKRLNLICLRFWSGKFSTTVPEETGKISTPKCTFQSAFLHVYKHLNDPSSADSCYRKNAIVILCKWIPVEYHKHPWIVVHCRMWILCALTLCWITNDVGLTCLLQHLLHKSCTLSCGIKNKQQHTFLLLTLSVSYCQEAW